MHFKGLTLTALASVAAAQNNSLVNVLNSQPSLSNLTAFVAGVPGLATALGTMTNVTLLAPNNEAFMAFQNSRDFSAYSGDTSLQTSLLTYHVLNGTYPTITNTSFIHTHLTGSMFTNVTGGQVVEATTADGTTSIYSGLLRNSTVVSTQALNFSGGVVHIIDRVLTVPYSIGETALDLNLTSAVGALMAVNVTDIIDTRSDLTVFIPDNEAFQAIGSAVGTLTMQQLTGILEYHVIGAVAYSTDLMNDTMYPTLQGTNVTIRMEDGDVYVNSARVVIPDVLVANGVVHVIDGVLNPGNATATPNPGTTEPAFAGASSMTELPFTSSLVPATTTVSTSPVASVRSSATSVASSEASAAASSSSSGDAWRPAVTGAMGAAALFGGAAMMVNNL